MGPATRDFHERWVAADSGDDDDGSRVRPDGACFRGGKADKASFVDSLEYGVSRVSDAATDELAIVSERIARIPDRYRRFTESAQRAQRLYRITQPTLERLLDRGLPHRSEGGQLTFDVNDLKSVSMALRTRSPHRIALASLADALAAGEAAVTVEHTVRIQAQCPDPGHEGSCAFRLAPEARRSPDTVAVRDLDPRHFEIEVRVSGGAAHVLDLTEPERQLACEAQQLRFHRIPHVLGMDLGFLAETGLADCRLATIFLAQRGAQLGVAIRGATGLFLSRPFAPRHFWIELRRDDGWVPADPFFLTALARWGLLDSVAWPASRSPRGAFWKLEIGPGAALVTHEGGSPVSII